MKKLLLVLFMLPTIVFGRKFYVSNSGSDGNSFSAAQSISTPWATLSKVQSSLSSFSSGDSILFAKGSRFTGTLTVQSKTGLYFGAYGTGANPLFWGTGATIGSLVTLRGCTNVTFYGWNISDTTISFTDRTVQAKIQIVFTIESSSTGTVIRKCTMDRIGYGVYITATSRAQTIDSCDIGNLRMIRNTPTSVNPDDDYGGVPVQFSSRNNIFTNNYLHDCYSVSYDYGYDGGGVEFFEEGDSVNNNIIMYNTFYDCNGTFEFGSNSDGVARFPQSDNVIAYNKIINSSSFIYINNNGQYRTKVTNLQLYNNIFVQNVASRTGDANNIAMATTDATTGIIVLKNNIFYVTNGSNTTRSGQWNAGQLTHSNNIFTLSGGSLNFTLDATERSSLLPNWNNTTNVNPLYWDFNLLSTSYAVSNGVNLGFTKDFSGASIIGVVPFIGIYKPSSNNPLSISANVGTISCYQGSTTVVITASGGSSPYYGTGTFSAVSGVRTFVVQDVTGSTASITVTIPQPSEIISSVKFTPISVVGGTTTVEITSTGGAGTKVYSLDAGSYQSSPIFTGVTYGLHVISVKDINNCIHNLDFNVTYSSSINKSRLKLKN